MKVKVDTVTPLLKIQCCLLPVKFNLMSLQSIQDFACFDPSFIRGLPFHPTLGSSCDAPLCGAQHAIFAHSSTFVFPSIPFLACHPFTCLLINASKSFRSPPPLISSLKPPYVHQHPTPQVNGLACYPLYLFAV